MTRASRCSGGSARSVPRRRVIASVGALTTAPPAAPSAFPGANGKIAFYTNVDGDVEIVTIDPDGSGLRNLTQSPGFDAGPSWSADGEPDRVRQRPSRRASTSSS